MVQRLPPVDVGRESIRSDFTLPADSDATLSTSLASWRHDGVEPWDVRLFLGYDRGFLIAADRVSSDYVHDAEFLMRINSWLQMRHTLFDSDGPNRDQNAFSFERLRLSFGGHVMSPDLRYFFQFDGNSDRATDVVFSMRTSSKNNQVNATDAV